MRMIVLIIQALILHYATSSEPPPHIVVILADDLGWNEVSWHNPAILTPRMHQMSAEGLRLARSYVHTKCSPSRAALMTGKYAWRLGLQRGAIERYLPTGLNTSIKILPEYLKEGGYSTHLVGKWHLGYCHEAYLPTRRGFDSFFGQYGHVTDYYNRTVKFIDPLRYGNDPLLGVGYDLHDNEKVTYEGKGEFSTDLYSRKAVEVIANHNMTQPLFLYLAFQAPHLPVTTPPQVYTSMYRNLRGFELQKSATISAMDAGVGRVYDALKQYGLYDNSVIIFSTDNGGAQSKGANAPLCGVKEQLYDGGVRGVGFINSPLLTVQGRTSTDLMFVTDWFATIMDLAKLGPKVPEDTDSISMWESLRRKCGTKCRSRFPARSEILLNIDQDLEQETWSSAIIKDGFKLIWGQDYLLKQKMPEKTCNVELYNVEDDPSEKINLAGVSAESIKKLPAGSKKRKSAKANPQRIADMKKKIIDEFRSSRFVEADYPRQNPRGFPGNNGGLVTTGWCSSARV